MLSLLQPCQILVAVPRAWVRQKPFASWSVLILALVIGCGDGDGDEQPEAGTASAPQAPDPVTRPMTAGSAMLVTSEVAARRTAARRGVDPSQDGWTSETLAAQAKKQLDKLGRALGDPAALHWQRFESLVADRFSCNRLRPAKLHVAYEDDALRVRRGEVDATSVDANVERMYQGSKGLAEALRALVAPFGDAARLRAEFKVYDVQESSGFVDTRQLVSISGLAGKGMIEQHARWHCRWERHQHDASLRLVWIDLETFEETTSRKADGPLFADCTKAVLGDDPAYREQLRHGKDYWASRIVNHVNFGYLSHSGLAIGDVNGDGLDDVYVCQPGGLPNRLLLQQPDGTAKDAAERAGLDILDFTFSALIVDLDNDGDQDMVVLIPFRLLVYENDGQGVFQQSASRRLRSGSALSVVDYDGDGYLDIYVCAYRPTYDSAGELPNPLPYHDAINGGRNILLRSEVRRSPAGNWKFSDVTDEVGLNENNTRWSFAAAWEDIDNDGDQDLYVANDYGRNNLYRNDLSSGGGFTDIAQSAGAEDPGQGMSVSFADFNRDGWMDIYVANMFSAAGRRITDKQRFQPSASSEQRAVLRRFARGNSLLQNTGNGRFEDVSVGAGVVMGRWGWSALFADINNDGWEDLWATNGYITGSDSQAGDL